MAINSDARLTIGLKGQEEVIAAAKSIQTEWERAGSKISAGWTRVGGAIGESLKQAGSDLMRLANVALAIDFAKGIQGARSFEEATTRISIAAGTSLDKVKSRIKEVAEATGLSEDQVAGWGAAVGKVTHNFEGAISSAKTFREFGLRTGQTLEELAPLAQEFTQSFNIKDPAKALGSIDAQAKALGMSTAAATAQLGALGGVASRLSPGQDFSKFSGLSLALGRGLTEEQGKAAQQSVLGSVLGNTVGFQRYVGFEKSKGFFDEQGRIKDLPGFLLAIREKLGHEKNASLRARASFGDLGGAAFMGLSADALGLGEGGALGSGATSQYLGSEAGKNALAARNKEEATRALAGKAAPFLRTLETFAGEHPLLTFGANVVGGAVGKSLLNSIFSGGGSGLAAGGGALGANAMMGLGAAAVPGGIAAGTVGALLEAGYVGTHGKAFGEAIGSTTGELAQRARLGRVAAIARAGAQAQGDPAAMAAALGPALMAQIQNDKQLQLAASSVVNQQMQPGMADDIKTALKEAVQGLQIVIVNNSDADIEAVNLAKH